MLSRTIAVAVAFMLPTPLASQVCTGLPYGQGLLAIGFAGTDGATGRGADFAFQAADGSVQINGRSLDSPGLIDRRESWGTQLAGRLPRVRIPLCLSLGVERAAYSADRVQSVRWDPSEPVILIERQALIGDYRRWRVPVMLHLGQQVTFASGLEIVPTLRAGVSYEAERLVPVSSAPRNRDAVGPSLGAGLTFAQHWFILRAEVDHTWTRSNALSSINNFPVLPAQIGVRFQPRAPT